MFSNVLRWPLWKGYLTPKGVVTQKWGPLFSSHFTILSPHHTKHSGMENSRFSGPLNSFWLYQTSKPQHVSVLFDNFWVILNLHCDSRNNDFNDTHLPGKKIQNVIFSCISVNYYLSSLTLFWWFLSSIIFDEQI